MDSKKLNQQVIIVGSGLALAAESMRRCVKEMNAAVEVLMVDKPEKLPNLVEMRPPHKLGNIIIDNPEREQYERPKFKRGKNKRQKPWQY